MRGESAEDVAQKLIAMDPLLAGLQGPTVSQVFSRNGSGVSDGEFYGVTVCIPKNRLYESVKKLRSVRARLSPSHSHSSTTLRSERCLGLWAELKRWFGTRCGRHADWRQRHHGVAAHVHLRRAAG
jgi:hypothetical protein